MFRSNHIYECATFVHQTQVFYCVAASPGTLATADGLLVFGPAVNVLARALTLNHADAQNVRNWLMYEAFPVMSTPLQELAGGVWATTKLHMMYGQPAGNIVDERELNAAFAMSQASNVP